MSTTMPTDVNPTHDPETGIYRVQLDTDEQASTTAILAVAAIAEVCPLEMEPVYKSQNLDVLDTVATALAENDAELEGELTVTIEDHRVALRPDGSLVIDPPSSNG